MYAMNILAGGSMQSPRPLTGIMLLGKRKGQPGRDGTVWGRGAYAPTRAHELPSVVWSLAAESGEVNKGQRACTYGSLGRGR